MNVHNTIQQLNDGGFTVRASHARKLTDGPDVVLTYQNIKRQKIDGSRISAKGGATYVTITGPNGQRYWGESKCSDKDAFSRRTGMQLALSRAIAELHKTKE